MEKQGAFLRKWIKKKGQEIDVRSGSYGTFIDPDKKCMHFSYNTSLITFCIQLFIVTSVSYRACSKICSVLSSFIVIRTPHYTTIRQWVLRFGYYKLQKPKLVRNDWAYILDYTIASGKNKCLAILGVSLDKLRKTNFSPKMQDVELLHLSVTPKATWEITYNALVKTSKETGTPTEIISDHGADVKKGSEEFCKKNKDVKYIYDITHMIACILKATLSGQAKWNSFIKHFARCKQQTKQSTLSFLSPPSQRAKSRYLNIDQMVDWGTKLLRYKEKGDFTAISKAIAEKNKNTHNVDLADSCASEMGESIKLFNDKFKWLDNFRNGIREYQQYIDIIKTVKKEVACYGINSETIENVEKATKCLKLNEPAIKFKNKVISGIESNFTKQLKIGEAYLGCSDIIESLFGKYKNCCSENSMFGITKSILIIAAATSKLNYNTVKKALEFSTYNDIDKWSNLVVGESDFSRRKIAFNET